ncbi:MAG: ArnT family glycosyltransferase [Flavobacteriales bacterium]
MFALSLIYSWPAILPLRPQGVHVWRQTDCLSLADHYYRTDESLLEPQIHCYISDANTTGKTASEFPGIYYVVGKLWKIFGKHEWMYRLLSMLLFMSSLWLFAKALRQFVKPLGAMLFAASLAASPVLIYYATNFLPDIHAFSFVLAGASMYVLFARSHSTRYLWAAMICFMFAGLFKVTAMILPLVVFGLLTLETIGVKLSKEGRVFPHRWKQFSMFLIVFAVVASWYAYAVHYCTIHGGKYSFNSLWPIWEASDARVNEILLKIGSFMLGELYAPIWSLTLVTLLLVCIFYGRVFPRWMWYGFAMLVLALTAQSLLWFQALDIHDYYWITMFVLPAVILLMFAYLMFLKGGLIFSYRIFWIGLFASFSWSVWYAANNSNMRYFVREGARYFPNYNSETVKFYKYYKSAYDVEWRPYETIEPYLVSIGMTEDDLVITQPDPSFNISLYLMNRRGWSAMGDESNSSEGVRRRIEAGARWLLVLDQGMTSDKSFLNEYMSNPVGHYKGVSIYRLSSPNTNTS